MTRTCPAPATGLQPESALVKLLTSDAAVVAQLLGGVYPDRLPDRPAHDGDYRLQTALVYTRIGGPIDYHLRGPVATEMARFYLDIYGPSHQAVRAARNAVVAVLSGYRGTPPGMAVSIQGIFFEAIRGNYEPEPEYRTYRSNSEITVHYLES